MNVTPVIPGTVEWQGWPYEGHYSRCPLHECVELDGTAWEHEDKAVEVLRKHVATEHPEHLARRAEVKQQLQEKAKRDRRSYAFGLVSHAVRYEQWDEALLIVDVLGEIESGVSIYA